MQLVSSTATTVFYAPALPTHPRWLANISVDRTD
jgi:hypothetical protein